MAWDAAMTGATRRRDFVVHSANEIDGIRRACRATAQVRDQLRDAVRPGMTTLMLDQLAGRLIAATGGSSAFNGYRGFPGQICISVNDQVVHGIGRPDRVLTPGDVVSLDVGIRLDGFVGDTAATVCATDHHGSGVKELLEATRASLLAGIAVARSDNYVNQIGKAVEKAVTAAGFSVVRDFVGHGCGCELHEPPEIPNFATGRRGPRLRPGMVLAIEPMVNAGTGDVKVGEDGWTVSTADGELSAHFEHMVLITNGEAEILTCPKTA